MKAEDAKLPGAGISPKPCPGNGAAEKERLPESVRVRTKAAPGPGARWKTDETGVFPGCSRLEDAKTSGGRGEAVLNIVSRWPEKSER